MNQMDRTFILVPGRSSRQGVTLNEGKYTQGYIDETSILRMHPDDLRDVGVEPGDEVRMWNDVGSVIVPVISAVDECPVGLVFICYGDKSSQLMAGETHGTGMPDSKGLDVHIEAMNASATVEPTGLSTTAAAVGGGSNSAPDNDQTSGHETRSGRSTVDEMNSSNAAAVQKSRAESASATPASSRFSESLPSPKPSPQKSTAKQLTAAKTRSANGEREPVSTAQIVVVVVGLIALLILLLMSGQ